MLIRRFRERLHLVFLIGAAITAVGTLPGCGAVEVPPARLAVSLTPSHILYDPLEQAIPLSLVVHNAGRAPLKIFKVDAGCACRKIDLSQFPRVLNPGTALTVPVSVSVSGPQDTGESTYLFQFQTDVGLLQANSSAVLLPLQSVSPRSLASPALVEDEEWEFELVQRRIFKPPQSGAPDELVCPAQFRAAKVSTERGSVSLAPEYSFEDTTYKVRLLDRKQGSFKELFRFGTPGAGSYSDVPVVWSRVGFLSPVPQTVFLGARPTRVFLRCQEEDVELTRVRSAPAGVVAVVSSTREVSVGLTGDAPPQIDGFVEVDTTRPGKGPLKIPVRRFAVAQVGPKDSLP